MCRSHQYLWYVNFVSTNYPYRSINLAIFFVRDVLGIHLLGFLNKVSIFWHAFGTISLVIAVLAKAPTHQSARFVFTTSYDGVGASHAYVAIIGILMAQYTLSE